VNTASCTCDVSKELPHAQHDDWRAHVRGVYTRAATQAAVVVSVRVCAPTENSGLGCGSPTSFAGLVPGEWVLDLGSGSGFDCLAAAVEVGNAGRVIGVDMTPAMVSLARRHAAEAGVAIAHFLQGEIEHLPLPDETFDVVISNCVINLCADKERVLRETFRVLKPGGRLAVADIVAVAPVPAAVQEVLEFRTACIGSAAPREELLGMLRRAGFESEKVDIAEHSHSLLCGWAPGAGLEQFLAAANITATRPGRCGAHFNPTSTAIGS